MIPRVYLPPDSQTSDPAELDAEQSLYLTQALRLKSGAAVMVFDGCGNRREAILNKADKRRATLCLGRATTGPAISPVAITLIQGVASGDRMDWVVEKAVELGVARIVPVLCAQTTVKLTADRAAKRLAHWHRIAVAACRQSGRDDLPDLAPIVSLATATSSLSHTIKHRFVLHPAQDEPLTRRLGNAAQSPQAGPLQISILVGPESGLTTEEVQSAQACGFAPASLGPRVLRTETAGLVAATIIQSTLGDFANDCQIHPPS